MIPPDGLMIAVGDCPKEIGRYTQRRMKAQTAKTRMVCHVCFVMIPPSLLLPLLPFHADPLDEFGDDLDQVALIVRHRVDVLIG